MTVCPYSKISCVSVLNILVDCGTEKCPDLLDAYCAIAMHAGCFLVADYVKSHNITNCDSKYTDHLEDGSTEQFDRTVLLNNYAKLGAARRIDIGTDRDSAILSCTIGKMNCSERYNVTTTNTVEWGNCFVFENNISVRTGPEKGMTLEVYLANENVSPSEENDQVTNLISCILLFRPF